MLLETCICKALPTLPSVRTSSPTAAIRGTAEGVVAAAARSTRVHKILWDTCSSMLIAADFCTECFLSSSHSKTWEEPEWQSWWETWNHEGVISTMRVSLIHCISVFFKSRTRCVFRRVYVTGFFTLVENCLMLSADCLRNNIRLLSNTLSEYHERVLFCLLLEPHF